MSKKTYYEILGVDKKADTKTIKSAYRKLAMQYHPDKVKDGTSDEKMREINEAYEVLSDETKRSHYDKYGSSENYNSANAGQGFSGNPFEGFSGGFSDFFQDIFNFGGSSESSGFSSQRDVGQDYQMTKIITFIDSVNGTVYKDNFEKYELCLHCGGSGAESSADFSTCSDCNGKGSTYYIRRTFFGDAQSRETCKKCNGSGKKVTKKCKSCDGKKFIKSIKKMSVTIPAGVVTGTSLKLTGFGGPGQGNAVGDLYIKIIVKEHKYYTRDRNDVYLDFPVSFLDVLSENVVNVPTPSGLEKIKLKRSYMDTMVIKLIGKGVKGTRTSGDLKLKLRIIIPPTLSNSDINKILSSSHSIKDTTNTTYVNQVLKEK
ncbi:DnaJ domain-containing protein [Mycoplasmopsis alligatoris]|uniref:Chaperone protein DnaJ n=1 Tax=Mycoplasmopsis alligatoris A21JP2 TaxID=747682 RepID=D4XWE5_9BACT|nr:DnaJ domain-containing protein [Mycoplasmopsis alligatoris]EFF41262.1 putative chaperone protein DnaJ [Mycoplasmopsis alligatoris A21JP2]